MTVAGVIENTPASWSERAATEGTPWAAAGWSENGQVARFQAVLSHLNLRAGDSLLDYGCGPGRMAAFVPRDVSYYGYDTAHGMLERARADHPHRTFSDFIPEELFDHVTAVGCFNLPGSFEDTFSQIASLWHLSARRSLVVSLYRGKDDRCIRYGPGTLAQWVSILGARRYVIDASHLDNDLILGLFR